jgi:hypothetical protein
MLVGLPNGAPYNRCWAHQDVPLHNHIKEVQKPVRQNRRGFDPSPLSGFSLTRLVRNPTYDTAATACKLKFGTASRSKGQVVPLHNRSSYN